MSEKIEIFLFSSEINRNLKLAFGHARLVTNGSQLNDSNNQPVVKDDIICIHNGIVVNADDLWKKTMILLEIMRLILK